MKGRYSDVDNDLLKMIAVHADKNPALLAFLVEESRRVEICSRDLSKVSEFCTAVIAQRMRAEFRREMKSSFARMPPDDRRNLRRLFNRRTGITRLALEVIGKGWRLYVGPFTTPLSHGDSSRSGYVYVDPAEELIYLESLPFEAFVTSIITPVGSLQNYTLTGFAHRFCNVLFNRIVERFGETCAKKPLHSRDVLPRIQWFCGSLPQRMMTVSGFVESSFVREFMKNLYY